MNSSKPVMCSICMITYNQDAYITEAIESILEQNTSFSYEIVIGEDASTDKTAEICRRYEEQYPEIFNITYHSPNLGMMENFKDTIIRCRGKYIALLEGDDYWIDKNKLQKQVDLLEKETDKSFCFHDIKVLEEKGNGRIHPQIENQLDFLSIDLINQPGSIAQTCSIVFRRKAIKAFPDWFDSMPVGDWPLQFILSDYGPAKYIKETMAVYRIHENGIWSKKDYVLAWKINYKIYTIFLSQISNAIEIKLLQQRITELCISAAKHLRQNRRKTELKFWLISLLSKNCSGSARYLEAMKIIFQLIR